MRQNVGVDDERASCLDALYVAARAPRPGFTKSRLGRVIGHERAAALYSAFVQDLAERLANAPFAVGWYVTPDDAWSELAPLMPASSARGDDRRQVIAQPPGDWTERQRALFSSAHARHEQRTVLIASDSPHVGLDLIVEAFDRLRRDDLVLGPTDDGGYYLLGMRMPGCPAAVRPWDVLTGVRMSTGTVLSDILSHAASLHVRASLLPATFDIDEATDLARLIPLALSREDLAATRAVLKAHGLIPAALAPLQQAAGSPIVVGGGR